MKFLTILLSSLFFAASGYTDPVVMENPYPSKADVDKIRADRQALRNASLEEKVNYLLDRAEITDLITAYAYSVDTRDWALHDSIFTETFQMNIKGDFVTVDSTKRVGALNNFFKQFTATQHLGFPLFIEIDGDEAYTVASLHARHFNENGKPSKNTLLFGQYEYWLTRGEDGWRISKMAMVNRTRFHTSAATEAETDE